MRRIFTLIICLATAVQALHAQTYANEWIDYNKTYFKFKVGKTGIYRIPQALLATYGLGDTPVEQLQLWHNGQQVALFTSNASGIMNSSDYAEFYGEQNDGTLDTKLYQDTGAQLSTHFSLMTDSSAYYLTVNAAGSNLRYSLTDNNTASPPVSPEAYFMYTAATYPRNIINPGYGQYYSGEYFYASTFDAGEGITTNSISPATNYTPTFSNLHIYSSGPAASIKAGIAGTAPNNRNVNILLNNQSLLDSAISQLTAKTFTISNIPLSAFAATNSIRIRNESTTSTDRIVVAFIELTYPHDFNFSNASQFNFRLDASAQPKYLEITAFNTSGQQPVLYDLSNHLRLAGDIATAGKVKFLLPPSAQPRELLLVNEAVTANINIISSLHQRNFVNYADAANQGNYLIITNSVLLDDGSGNNYVQQYADYRSSAAGGGYRARVALMDQLEDQFAYGIKNHPLSIRNFAQYAYDHFAVKPAFIFLIGKGITYDQYRFNETNPTVNKLQLVPTFGYPGSDNLLTAFGQSIVPQIPVGRLSVITPGELGNYLDKVKQYELVLQDKNAADQTYDKKAWQKNILQVIGADDRPLATILSSYFKNYESVMEDTLYGGNVYPISKFSTDPVVNSGAIVDTIFARGASLVSYFGHSSANLLGFNLDKAEQLNNTGKYPVFIASGCNAGDLFIMDSLRLTSRKTLSEDYLLTPDAGSIVFIASTYLGITTILDLYNTIFCKSIGQVNYGAPLGKTMQYIIQTVVSSQPGNLFHYANAEQMTLHGDPAIRSYSQPLPDYDIEEKDIIFDPVIVSVAQNNFRLKVNYYNIGKAINDSCNITIKRVYPDGKDSIILNKRIMAPHYADSLSLLLPINPVKDVGLNKFIVTIDNGNEITEATKANNQAEKDITIYSNNIRPVYPFEFSIVNKQPLTCYASTEDPFAPSAKYFFEIDTTGNFNSPLKQQLNTSSIGGLLSFKPSIALVDSTVYYWRVSAAPADGQDYNWNNSSFIYLPGSVAGWNQSHYFQYLRDNYSNMDIGTDRKFQFNTTVKRLKIETGLYPYYESDQVDVILDNERLTHWGCSVNSLSFVVLDSLTYRPWENHFDGSGMGRFGSAPTCANEEEYLFEFPYGDASYRKSAMNFLDSIPNGMWVCLTNFSWAVSRFGIPGNTTFIADWMKDTTVLGPGKSLYHKLKALGFSKIDSFYHNIPFIFYFKKGYPDSVIQIVGDTASDYLTQSINVNAKAEEGSSISGLIGPAQSWSKIQWSSHSIDRGEGDTTNLQIFGVNNEGDSILLYNNTPADTSLSFISAKTYPYLQLRLDNTDTNYATPAQLDYWRVQYQPVPEGAVAPAMYLNFQDTLDLGQSLDFSIAFANISETAFDSLNLKVIVTDQHNVPHTLPVARFRKLLINDTLHITYSIDTKSYPGLNTLYVEVNPDNDQPEQYHFNNYIYKQFFVKSDTFNPLLDVTFDGMHILNNDIVSSRPHITIKLKDESRYLAIDDTSLIRLQVQYPDGSLHQYYFNGDTVRFIPANPGDLSADNSAQIDFLPAFLSDGTYELIVNARDKSNNSAGSVAYRVAFEIVNKPMISNLLNYPNPFTTSTAFVFTLTGYEIPSQLKIEIMTITGKIVREITKEELGPLHIGRNITTYRWDGTDQYGQKLGNGIYLYRVVASLKGNKMDLYKTGADKFITHGYGKMYLMR